MRKKAIIYARVSTGKQSVERQVSQLNEYADKNDYDIIETVCEEVSGFRNEERDGINQLKLICITQKVNSVLIYEISRLGRRTSHVLIC